MVLGLKRGNVVCAGANAPTSCSPNALNAAKYLSTTLRAGCFKPVYSASLQSSEWLSSELSNKATIRVAGSAPFLATSCAKMTGAILVGLHGPEGRNEGAHDYVERKHRGFAADHAEGATQ